LNHPNICTVYEFGEHEGHPFLVMELLQGQTLRDRLTAAQGGMGLPLEELLDIAMQVSSGLQAAHERGIIHRDIKPANIYLTHTGIAKILDFGLAKLLDPSEPEAETQEAPELQPETPYEAALSRFGLTLGTAGYMSPEQARGEKLDARTDLFSFGLVLYEMATGQRAFSGGTAETVREAIVHQLPAGVRNLNSSVPPELEAIIDNALEKDRERRCQSAAEMRAGLERVQRGTDSGRLAAHQRTSSDTQVSDAQVIGGLIKRRKRAIVALLIGACLTAAAALAWVWRSGQHSPALTEVALTQNSFEAPVVDAAISPNGNLLAYADVSGLNLKVISSGEVRSLSTPAVARVVRIAWFPDSSNLLFTSISTQSSGLSPYSAAGPACFGATRTTPRSLRMDQSWSSAMAPMTRSGPWIGAGETHENCFPKMAITSITLPGMPGERGFSTWLPAK